MDILRPDNSVGNSTRTIPDISELEYLEDALEDALEDSLPLVNNINKNLTQTDSIPSNSTQTDSTKTESDLSDLNDNQEEKSLDINNKKSR